MNKPLRPRFEALLSFVPSSKSGDCLDIGSDNAHEIRERITELGYKYTAIDIRPTSNSILMDARCMSFQNSSFDLVLLSCVLMYIEEVDLVLSETSRILKKGGFLVLLEPSSSDWLGLAEKPIDDTFSIKERTHSLIRHQNNFSLPSLVNPLLRTSFSINRLTYDAIGSWLLIKAVKI